VGSVASTTEVGDDVDGGPPGGRCRWGPVVSTTEFKDNVDGGPPRGVVDGSSDVHHRG
jgi:hypothetical protein